MKVPYIFNKITYGKSLQIIMDEKWTGLSLKNQKEIVEVIFEYEKELLFKDKNFNIDLKFYSDNSDRSYGKYNKTERAIYINEIYFNKYPSKYEIYKIVCHELYHVYQNYLELNNLLDNKEIELSNFYIDGTNNHFQFLNFDNNGNFHINIIRYCTNSIENLSSTYYHLNSVERQAFKYQNERCKNIFKENPTDDLKDFIIFLNDYYNLSLPEEQIYELVDKCFYNLSQNLYPETDLEASIMYDISCLALLNNDKISEIECAKMLKENYKKAQLAEYGYCLNEEDRYGYYIITNSLALKATDYVKSKDDFQELTKFEQQDNPQIILLAISNLQEDIREDICVDILDYLFTYASINEDMLYPIHIEKLQKWYPDKFEEYFNKDELEM